MQTEQTLKLTDIELNNNIELLEEIQTYDTEDILDDYTMAIAYNDYSLLTKLYKYVLELRGVKLPIKVQKKHNVYAPFKAEIIATFE